LDEKTLKISEHGTVTTDLDELIDKLIQGVLGKLNLREGRDVDNNWRASGKANKENQRSADLASVAVLRLDEAPLKTIAHEARAPVGEEMSSLVLLAKRLLSLAKEALLKNTLSKAANADGGASSEDLVLGEEKLDLKGTSNDATSDLFNVLQNHGSRLGERSRANSILNRREHIATGEFNLSSHTIALHKLQIVNVDTGGDGNGLLLLGEIGSTFESIVEMFRRVIVRLHRGARVSIDLNLVVVEVHLFFRDVAVALREHVVEEEWTIGVTLKEVRVDGLADIVRLDIALGHLSKGTLHKQLGLGL
jgi:hypothetical protein